MVKGRHAREMCFSALLVVLFVALILWGYSATPVLSMADKLVYEYLHQGWSQVLEDGLVPLEDIHDFTPVEPGELLVLQCTLPEVTENNALLFYSEHQEVYCYVDGQQIQKFTMDEKLSSLQTPGKAWNQVDFTEDMGGKTCTLIFCSYIEEYGNEISDIYFLESEDVDGLRLGYWWFHGLVVFCLFILLVIAFINGIMWKRKGRKRYFFSLSALYLFVILWMLADLGVYDFLFRRPVLSYLIGEFFFRLIPVALIALAKNSTNRYEHPKILRGLEILSMVNSLLPWLLQFTLDIPLLKMEVLNRVTVAVVAVTLLIVMGKKWTYIKKLDREEYPALAFIVLLLGGIADIICLRFAPSTVPLTGLWSVAGCVLYTVSVFILFISLDSKHDQEKEELQQSYHRLQNTLLVQQIKAHFFFNVLNTISAFCKEDARKADRAIQTFSAYLRSYLHFITLQESIPVEKELEMVKNYLTVEQMRFGERLTFAVYGDYTAFEVPPFAIQTLVENAVVHGIRGQERNGKVVIITQRSGDFAQVIVKDNGVGFDTNAPFEKESVGLANVKKRVRIMSGGTITIHSKIGEGTRVEMTIPFENA